MIELKRRCYRVGPNLIGRRPYKNRARGVCSQPKDHVRTRREESHLQAERGGETSPAGTLILDFQPPEL